MNRSRMEAFSDAVIAIIITIMVLELRVPHGPTLNDLMPLRFIMMSYVLSFIYIAIYWNNHHHLFQTVKEVNGATLWANLHLLFWLSLVPFVTAWSGENHFESIPTMLYGFVLFMAACAYTILTKTIIAQHGDHSLLARAIGKDFKGKISLLLYFIAIPLALVSPATSFLLFTIVAGIWFIPDRRIEKKIDTSKSR